MFLNRWAQGYDGSPALFVNRDTVCFVCGNNVKFINSKDKRESVLASPGDGIGALAVNPLYSNVAFAELKINPKLFVYVYPDFSRPRATLEGETLNSILVTKMEIKMYIILYQWKNWTSIIFSFALHVCAFHFLLK